MGGYQTMTGIDDSPWGVLTIAGLSGFCCVGLLAFSAGATVTGGTAAGVTAATGAVTSIGGFLVTALASALPILVVGLVLRPRAK
jgi:hypothetical protein